MLTNYTLLNEIERYLERSGMTDSHFGHVAISNSKLLERLRNGGTVRLEKAQKIMRFILLDEIDGYLRREQITESRLGELAIGDRTIVGQIRAGAVITPVEAERLLIFIRLPHPAARAAPPSRLELFDLVHQPLVPTLHGE